MKSLLAALITITPALASAQEAFGDATGCAMHRGEPLKSDNLYLFDYVSVQRMESSCPISNLQQAGAGAFLLTVECSGEGETWEDYYMVETTSSDDTLVIYPSDYPEFRTEISLCR